MQGDRVPIETRVAWRAVRRPAAPEPSHGNLSRKALLEMTMQPDGRPRRIRAAIIGLGFDGEGDGDPTRLSTGEQCLLLGGSSQTHADMLETMLRLESELDRLGCRLADVPPDELADIAWRIDSPELHAIALQLHANLEREGRNFEDATAEQLTALSTLGNP